METSRPKIEETTGFSDMITIMSEGIPGALRVLCELVKAGPTLGLLTIVSMDTMNIRGSQIWIAYKNFCDSNVRKLMALIESNDAEFVEKLNSDTYCLKEKAHVRPSYAYCYEPSAN